MDFSYIQMSPAENAPVPVYQWGIGVITLIQELKSPAFTAVMKFITELGTGNFYLAAILIIFWLADEKRGLRLGILIIVSAWINVFLKDFLKHPRPFNLEPSLGLAYESTYGAPSGHAQMSVCFWIPMAVWFDQIWEGRKRFPVFALAVLFILLIGFTRLYLGLHFPTDLFAGWFLGGVILAFFFLAGPVLAKYLATGGSRFQNIAAAVTALLMNGIYPEGGILPAILLGFCIGYSVMRKKIPFLARGEIRGKKPSAPVLAARCLVGFSGLAVIYTGLRLILPGEGSLFGGFPVWGEFSPFYDLGRFIRYAIIGLWVSAGAPMVFQRVGLASTGDGGGS